MKILHWMIALRTIVTDLWETRGNAPELILEKPEVKIVVKMENRSEHFGSVPEVLVVCVQKKELVATIKFCGRNYSESKLELKNCSVDPTGYEAVPLHDRSFRNDAIWTAGNILAYVIRELSPETQVPERPASHWDAFKIL